MIEVLRELVGGLWSCILLFLEQNILLLAIFSSSQHMLWANAKQASKVVAVIVRVWLVILLFQRLVATQLSRRFLLKVIINNDTDLRVHGNFFI